MMVCYGVRHLEEMHTMFKVIRHFPLLFLGIATSREKTNAEFTFVRPSCRPTQLRVLSVARQVSMEVSQRRQYNKDQSLCSSALRYGAPVHLYSRLINLRHLLCACWHVESSSIKPLDGVRRRQDDDESDVCTRTAVQLHNCGRSKVGICRVTTLRCRK